MSKENILFVLEDSQENKEWNEEKDRPCFCQEGEMCFFCLNLCTINSPTNGQFISDKGNSYQPLKMCEGVSNEKETNEDNDELTRNTLEFLNAISGQDEIFSKKVDYQVNYTVKQLSMICEYYGLLKTIKGKTRSKTITKKEWIEALVEFEENMENAALVFQRKRMWFFLDELKKDPFMRRYIL